MTNSMLQIFVEDPGAANYVVGLARALAELGIQSRVCADGAAAKYLAERKQSFVHLDRRQSARDFLNQQDTGAVLVGTSENRHSFSFDLIDAARAIAMPSIGIVDARTSPELRFRGETEYALTHAPDHLLVPDASTEACFVQLGMPQNRVHDVGNPTLDRAIKKARELAHADRYEMRRELFGVVDERTKVIVFASETSDGLDPHAFRRRPDYSLTGRGQTQERTAIVLEEILDALNELRPRPQLLLRLHPKENAAHYASYNSEILRFSEGGQPYQILYFANLVIGLTSTILAESAAMGVPTLSVVPREAETEWVPIYGGCRIPVAYQRCEVRSKIDELLQRPREAIAIPNCSLHRIAGIVFDLMSDRSRIQ